MTHESPPSVHCPLCGGATLYDFYLKKGVPVTCASVFTDAAQARQIARGNIDLAACERCGFAFNRSFEPGLGELGARYESSQAASAQFNQYAAALARSWVTRHRLENKTVLEVGCGDGNFLRALIGAGVGHAIGLDPLVTVSQESAQTMQGIERIPRRFDASLLDIAADALVCRHTLEHVPDVHGFLTLLRQWATGGHNRVVLLDLPDAERVFAERAFWDIYYEHCNYFTADTLRRAFAFAGFHILALSRDFHGQYLTVEALPDPASAPRPPGDSSGERALYHAFAIDIHKSLQRCEIALDRLKRPPQPLMLWQGSSKTVGFLSSLAHPEVIDGAVDVNPQRHGIFLPGSGLPVYAPEKLKEIKPRHVILMNPAYQEEVAKMLTALRLDVPLHPVDALLR